MKHIEKRYIRIIALALAALLLLGGGAMAETFSAIVTASSMPVYGDAAMSRQLGTLQLDEVVRITGYSNTIAKFSYNGKTGYARVSDLSRVEDVAVKAVTNAAAPAYRLADTASESVTVPAGTKLYVLSVTADWARVEQGGATAYIKTDKLTRADDDWTVPQPTAAAPEQIAAENGITLRTYFAVTTANTAFYKSASTKSAKLGTLKPGIQVTVLATSSAGWAYAELNGKRGFCKLANLKEGTAEDYEATPAPDATPAPTVDSRGTLPAGWKKCDVEATVVAADARVYASASVNSENRALKQGASLRVVGYNSSWTVVQQGGSYGFVPIKQLSKASYAAISGDGSDLQTLLKALLSLGYYDAVPSASYNAAAIAAIKRFQSACGMEETGVADQAMLRIVYSGQAPSSSLLFSTLKTGDRIDAVSRLQARLYALGYLSKSSSLDGDFGSNTAAAVKLFQNASGISATGTADPATLKALYNPEAKKLPSGSKAADATATTTSSGGSSSTYLDNMPAGLASTTADYSSGMSAAEKLEYAIYLAQGKLGKPYVYGATGPDKFDCSGLTTWAFKAVGVSLKRSAYNQGYDEDYPKIEGVANLKRGDLVFFNTISDSDLSDHTGIYLGNGYFIHASSGAHRVVVSNLTTGYYARVYSWGRRILK